LRRDGLFRGILEWPPDFIRLLSPFDFGFAVFQKRHERGATFEFVTDRLCRRAPPQGRAHHGRESRQCDQIFATLLPANDGLVLKTGQGAV